MSRALLALVLLLAFAAIAFGWRTVVQLRRHGDSGWRVRPGAAPVARVAHVLFLASLLLAVAAPIVALATGWDGPSGTVGVATAVVGAAVMVGGSALALVAQVQMGASWRIGVDEGERTELVTHGLFAHLRNPIFTGMLAGVAGEALLLPTPLGLAALVVTVVALQLQVRRIEEPYLAATHGEPYRTWSATAGRFLPRWPRAGGLSR